MPKGPKGQKRPADVIGAAIMVAKIATGEVEEDCGKVPTRAKGGKRGAAKRSISLTDEQKSEIARVAANARWKKKSD